MRDLSRHPELFSLNTATVRKQAPLDRIIEACVARGIGLIDPWRDQVQAVGLDKALPGTLAFFVLDFAPAPVPFQALGQNVYIGFTPAMQTFFPGLTQSTNAGSGYTSVRLPIPNDQFLTGLGLYGQWLVFDGNGPSGFASTGAISTTLF